MVLNGVPKSDRTGVACACGHGDAVVNARMNHPKPVCRWESPLCQACLDDLKRRMSSYGGDGVLSLSPIVAGGG